MSSSTPQKVTLSISLSLHPNSTLSLSPSESKTTTNLIATIRQLSSPHPTRPITLLTRYSALDTDPDEDAFVIGRLPSPVSINADPAKTIKLFPYEVRVNRIRVNGALDLREREGMRFITVPPLTTAGDAEAGSVQVSWEMSTASLLRFSSAPLDEKLAQYAPGERYKFTMGPKLRCAWWTWGSLDDGADGGEESLKAKKFSRWMLPEGVVRDGDDNGDQDWDGVTRKLRDQITGHNVNALGSRSCVEGEDRPAIPAMEKEGWVFSQPTESIEAVCENGEEGSVFEFVK